MQALYFLVRGLTHNVTYMSKIVSVCDRTLYSVQMIQGRTGSAGWQNCTATVSERVATEFTLAARFRSGRHPTPLEKQPGAEEESEIKIIRYNQNPVAYGPMCAENFSAVCCFYMALCSHYNMYYNWPCSKSVLRDKMNEKRQHLGICLTQY